MQLTELIGLGRYRECYAISESNLCAKKLKPFKMDLRSLKTHILNDINRKDARIYNRIPRQLKTFFPKTHYNNGSYLISERPRDYDQSFSKTLQECKNISNDHFWNDIEFIVKEMVKCKLWYFDVFHLGNNIIVQQVSEQAYKPIIIDFKRVGWSSYPLQINLLFPKEKERKLYRRLEQFKNTFKTD